MLAQILTREEVEALPMDSRGDFILCEAPYDYFPKSRLELCGKYVYAELAYSDMRGRMFYKLTPVNKEDESILNWKDSVFTRREFHFIEDPSRDPAPPPPISFADLMKNM